MTDTRKINHDSKEVALAKIAAEPFLRRTVSFYKYVHIEDPAAMRETLFEILDALGCKGRIYVATEGINAQMNVPLPKWDQFTSAIERIPHFSGVPFKIARQESNQPSFWKLTIKVKKKIVADGLDDLTFDPSDTGKYMSASEVNAAIEDPDTLLVDMRNRYEAEVGHFDGAHIMQVDTFREQLSSVEKELGDQKERKVLMYCTGGIRCEKASAWFKHKGFNDVAHIKGGIIDYDKQVKEQDLENKFRGKNFVFDERLGERISDEVIATCHVCSQVKADDHYNCKNNACHILYIACNSCLKQKDGYCSTYCMYYVRLPIAIRAPLTKYKSIITKKFFRPQFTKGKLKKG